MKVIFWCKDAAAFPGPMHTEGGSCYSSPSRVGHWFGKRTRCKPSTIWNGSIVLMVLLLFCSGLLLCYVDSETMKYRNRCLIFSTEHTSSKQVIILIIKQFIKLGDWIIECAFLAEDYDCGYLEWNRWMNHTLRWQVSLWVNTHTQRIGKH